MQTSINPLDQKHVSIPQELITDLRLTPIQRVLYLYLYSRKDEDFDTYEIMEDLDIKSLSTLENHLKVLRKHGLVNLSIARP